MVPRRPTRFHYSALLCGLRLLRLRPARSLGLDALRKLLSSRLAIPFLVRLVGDLPFHEELGKFPPLRLALEWHYTLTSPAMYAVLFMTMWRKMRQPTAYKVRSTGASLLDRNRHH